MYKVDFLLDAFHELQLLLYRESARHQFIGADAVLYSQPIPHLIPDSLQYLGSESRPVFKASPLAVISLESFRPSCFMASASRFKPPMPLSVPRLKICPAFTAVSFIIGVSPMVTMPAPPLANAFSHSISSRVTSLSILARNGTQGAVSMRFFTVILPIFIG